MFDQLPTAFRGMDIRCEKCKVVGHFFNRQEFIGDIIDCCLGCRPHPPERHFCE